MTGSKSILGSKSVPFVALQRVRLRLGRFGVATSLSHIQQIDMVRRALENSSWPVAKTEAHRPRVKVAFGPAISVGYESEAEYCDVELLARLDPKISASSLAPQLDPGYSLLGLKSIPRFFPSLEQSLNLGHYQIHSSLLRGTEHQWENFWAKDHLMVTKKKADRDVLIDARACVKSWSLKDEVLALNLRFGPHRTLKPEKVVQAVCGFTDEQVDMGNASSQLRIKRVQLYFEKENGELVEP